MIAGNARLSAGISRFFSLHIKQVSSSSMDQRKTLYDVASLILLALGGGMLLAALVMAIDEMWRKAILFAIACASLWYMSAVFARLAIAAAGRQ